MNVRLRKHDSYNGRAALRRGFDIWRRGSAALPLLAAMNLLAAGGGAAATTNDLSDAEIQGRKLAQQLCEARPVENFTNTGALKIKKQGSAWANHPIRFQLNITPTNWGIVYCSDYPTNNDILSTSSSASILEITHNGNQPNEYLLQEGSCLAVVIRGSDTMRPYADSDFWIADLGLEFFHWPQQKLLKKEVKRSRGCSVLQSTNPGPFTNGYSRVVSWIDNESSGIVQAEAYDFKNKRLKEFAPKSFKKVNGQWELQEMEIRNVQTGSRTRLEFDLKKE
jgi:hypothetical protein